MAKKLPKKWVVIRLSAMGDVALTTGVLDYWARTHGYEFTFITREAWAPLLEHHPAITEVVPLTKKDLTVVGWREYSKELIRFFKGQGLLDLHGGLRSLYLSLFWKGPVRRYPKFTRDRQRYLKKRHPEALDRLLSTNVPQRYALALEKTPPPKDELLPHIVLSEEEWLWSQQRLKNMGCNKPVAALHLFATHPEKIWPAAHWKALVPLLEKAGWDWYIIGQTPMPDAAANMAKALGTTKKERVLINANTLRQTAALLAETDVLITGDSGPMHVASGVNTPVIALFGPTHPAWGFAPFGPKDQLLESTLNCRPCSLHGQDPCNRELKCLNNITPEHVMEALQRITP